MGRKSLREVHSHDLASSGEPPSRRHINHCSLPGRLQLTAHKVIYRLAVQQKMETRSKRGRPSKITVAIIGGGFSGTILATQLLRRSHPSISVVVVEKTASVGRGLAYGSDCRSLLLNVRARNMSAFAEDPHHFFRWAQSNYDPAAGPGSFLPRAAYGHYVLAVLNEATQSAGKPRLDWTGLETRRSRSRQPGTGRPKSTCAAAVGCWPIGSCLPWEILLRGILWHSGVPRMVPVIFAIPGRPKPSQGSRISAASYL